MAAVRKIVTNPPPLNASTRWPFRVVEFPAAELFATGLFSPSLIPRGPVRDPEPTPLRREAR